MKNKNLLKLLSIIIAFIGINTSAYSQCDTYPTADAGLDSNICGNNLQLLAVQSPAGSIGTWTVISGSAVFSDNTFYNTYVSGLATPTNILEWTTTNGICSSTDQVTINTDILTIDAGLDATTCSENFIMNGEYFESGATWSIISGSGTFTNPNSYNSAAVGLSPGANKFRWSVTDSGCSGYGEVTITNNAVTATAGSNQNVCSDIVTMSATNPVGGATGTWTLSNGGGTIISQNNATTQITNLSAGLNSFTWTVDNGVCSAFEVVEITNNAPSTAVAGNDSEECVNNASLTANMPSIGTGTWSLISGGGTFSNPSSYMTSVNGMPNGANTYRWTIVNGICESYDDVIITNHSVAATIGSDFNTCYENETLNATSPTFGAGTWTTIFGSAVVTNQNQYNSTVTGLSSGTNTLRWTVSEGSCTNYNDVNITFNGTAVTLGSDKDLCTDNTSLNAPTPFGGFTGLWSVISGSGTISDISSNSITITNLDSNTDNKFRWEVTGNGCATSDDIIIRYNVPSNAAINTSSQMLCVDTLDITASNPTNGTGTWELGNLTGTFTDVNSNITKLKNISTGAGTLKWTVNLNGCTNTAQIALTNNTIASINPGINKRISSTISNITNKISLEAASPLIGTGKWSVIEGDAIITNALLRNSKITLGRGRNVLRWTITNSTCSEYKDIIIINAIEDLKSVATDGTIDWEEAGDWDGGFIPGEFDDVFVRNGQCIIKTNAKCRKLTVDAGSNVLVKGEGKVIAQLETQSIIIEQFAEKGTASMTVSGSSNVVIKKNENDVEDNSKVSTEYGVIIGSGGSLVIEQFAEKGGSGEKVNPAIMTLNAGATMVIEQTAEKGSSNAGVVNIRSGGSLIFDANSVAPETADLIIRNGGLLTIEDNSGTADRGTLEMAAGRTISVSDKTSKLNILGGEVIVEEGNTSSKVITETFALNSGASLVIEQFAEKTTGVSEAHLPTISVDGGYIIIGDKGTQNLINAKLYTRSLTLNSKTVSEFAKDTSLIMYSNSGLYIENGTTPSDAIINIEKGNAVTMFDGSEIDLTDGTKQATFTLENKASLVNYNTNNTFAINIEHAFKADETQYVTNPFKTATGSIFTGSTLSSWSETDNLWNTISDSNNLTSANAYKVNYTTAKTATLSGTLNTGSPIVSLLATDADKNGWNLTGNPFTSGIDLENITNHTGAGNAFYIYDATTKNYKLYQKGGVVLNDATQYVEALQGFFVKAETDVDLTLDNTAQTHYFGSTTKGGESISDFIKIKAEGNNYSDEMIVRFSTDADKESDNLDAYKKFADDSNVPQLFSTTEAGLDMAINTLPEVTKSMTVPVNFRAGKSGTYKITASDFQMNDTLAVMLKDVSKGTSVNLKYFTNYSFEYTTGSDYEFEIQLGETNSVNNINNIEGLNIFTSDNKINIQKSDLSPVNVKIFSITGSLVKEKNIYTEGTTTINMNSAQGIYFVKAQSGNKIYTQKVILK